MIAQIRKAIIAALAAFLTGFAPAWAQAHGFPGWDTTGGLAIFAALSGLGVWAVPNRRAVPDAVLKLRADAASRRLADQYAGTGQKPAAVVNVPPRPLVAPSPPPPSGR